MFTGELSSSYMGEECPVVIKTSPSIISTSISAKKGNTNIESRLAAVSLDVLPVMEAVTGELNLLQSAANKLQDSNEELVEENAALRERLIVAMGQNNEINRVHNVQEETLRAQMASMQAQMERQAAEQQAEVQRLQTLLATAQREKTDAVATVQTVWEQQKIEMNQQKRDLQNQVTSLSAERTLLNTQVTSLSAKCCSLETQVRGEPLRQQAAIIQKLAPIKAQLDDIISHVNHQLAGYDQRFTKNDVVWIEGSLSSLSSWSCFRDPH